MDWTQELRAQLVEAARRLADIEGGIPGQAVNVDDSPSNAAHQALKAIDGNDNNANVSAALTRPNTGSPGSASPLGGTHDSGPPGRPLAAGSPVERRRARDEP